MRELMKKLEEIQELDLMIDKAMRTKAEFPKRVANYDLDIRTRNTKKQEFLTKMEALEKASRQNKGALELNEGRARKSQERLAQIKSNDEYQALLKELDSLKKSSMVLQEADTKVINEIGKLQAEIEKIQKVVEEIESKKNEELQKINSEMGDVDKHLSELEGKRGVITEGVDTRYLSSYNKIRGIKGGLGIAPIVGGVCKGCHIAVRPQLYVEIQRFQELHTCPTCGRYLAYRAAPGATK